MIILAKRASCILFSLLRSNPEGAYILPANVCGIVPMTFLKAGVEFAFADISPHTLCLDEEAVLGMMKEEPRRFRGVVHVHTYGLQQNFNPFFTRLREVNPEILIIDDRCPCPPELDGKCDQADVLLYSTGYGKYLDIGGGGFAIIKDEVRYEDHAGNLRFSGRGHLETLENRYRQSLKDRTPFAYRDCPWLDCGSMTGTWETYREEIESGLPAIDEQKQAMNSVYRELLPQEIRLAESFQTWRFNIHVPEKERLLESIFEAGLFASSHFQTVSAVLSSDPFPVAEELHQGVINLFNDQHFSASKATLACQIINRHIEDTGRPAPPHPYLARGP